MQLKWIKEKRIKHLLKTYKTKDSIHRNGLLESIRSQTTDKLNDVNDAIPHKEWKLRLKHQIFGGQT